EEHLSARRSHLSRRKDLRASPRSIHATAPEAASVRATARRLTDIRDALRPPVDFVPAVMTAPLPRATRSQASSCTQGVPEATLEVVPEAGPETVAPEPVTGVAPEVDTGVAREVVPEVAPEVVPEDGLTKSTTSL